MVYRITVLSFTHSALISDRWLAFAFNITQNSFPKGTDFFPPSDESTPDMRQSRKQTFFSVAVLTTVKCDLFKTRYMFLRVGRGELRTLLKGNMSDGCQPPPITWYVFFLSHTEVFPTSDFRKTNSYKRSEQPCGRHMLEMGWFKLINVSWDLFVLQDVWTDLVQWECSTIAIWWNPGVSSPPNCAVCSVSLLSSLQKLQMISLIDYELEMYPPTQLLVFQDKDSVSLLTLSKKKKKKEKHRHLWCSTMRNVFTEQMCTLTFFYMLWQVH